MDIFDIIWTVVLVALVAAPELIGKAAGKQKRTSGRKVWPQVEPDGQSVPQDDGAEAVPQMPQIFRLPETPESQEMPVPVTSDEGSAGPVETKEVRPVRIGKESSGSSRRNVAGKPATVTQDAEVRHKERIDLKKLIIYTAIMRPKFDEA